MMFWDSSAIIPLLLEEPQTKTMRGLVKRDGVLAAWWGSLIECYSTLARLRREKILKTQEEDQVRRQLEQLASHWIEILPSQEVKNIAARLLLRHPLHAADSLQLAAALLWADKTPLEHAFVCLDRKLREAARQEGFTLLPIEA